MAVKGKMRRFCEYYAASPNATEAAKRAGYSEKTAYSQGQRLLKNVEVAEYIRELQEKSAGERIVSMMQVKAFWSDVMQNKGEKTETRLRASELLAKSAGAFLQVNTSDDGAGKTEDVIIYLPEIEQE